MYTRTYSGVFRSLNAACLINWSRLSRSNSIIIWNLNKEQRQCKNVACPKLTNCSFASLSGLLRIETSGLRTNLSVKVIGKSLDGRCQTQKNQVIRMGRQILMQAMFSFLYSSLKTCIGNCTVYPDKTHI